MKHLESGLMNDASQKMRLEDGIKRIKPIEYVILSNGCWYCTSHSYEARGYLKIRVRGVHERLHQHSYRIHNGKILKGKVIMHTCDNPYCFNPEHLKMGTQKANMRDMIKKGRNTHIGVKGRRIDDSIGDNEEI